MEILEKQWRLAWGGGGMIPLNARHLTMLILRQVGDALGMLSSLSAMCSELRLTVEEKLTELGYDMSNIQVTLSDETTLLMMKVLNAAAYMTDDSRDEVRSALEEHDQLCISLEAKEDTI